MLQAMILHNVVDPGILARLQDVVDNKPVNAVPPPSTASWAANSSYHPPPQASVPPPTAAVPPAGLDAQQQVGDLHSRETMLTHL